MKNRRQFYRKGLHQVYAKYYDSLCDLLPECWQPISSFRSPDEQAKLYAQGRTEPGVIVTYAKPGLSFHNYGIASDWDYFVDGKYSPLTAEDPLWKEYIDAVNKVGLKCLEFEKPHNQMDLGVTGKELFDVFSTRGILALDMLIRGAKGY